MIGKKGKDLVSIPLPQIEIPQFRYGKKGSGGVGQGDGEPGQPLGPGRRATAQGGRRSAGRAHPRSRADDGGDGRRSSARSWPCRASSRAARRTSSPPSDKYTGIRQTGPESLRHFKRTFKRALKRQIASSTYDPADPIVVPIREDKQYRSWKEVQQPQSVAVIIYMMDVSGSMTDEQKEIVRIEAFWIDTWIKAHYKGIETVYIIHDAVAQEVDEHTFYHTRESGGTKISSAYELADKIINARYPPDQWNIYAFHFSDGDNWGDDIPHCIEILTEKLLPKRQPVRLRPGGKPLRQRRVLRVHPRDARRARRTSCASRIPDREAILGSIKEFLGTGR